MNIVLSNLVRKKKTIKEKVCVSLPDSLSALDTSCLVGVKCIRVCVLNRNKA